MGRSLNKSSATSATLKTYYPVDTHSEYSMSGEEKKKLPMEEDELARIREIFKAFDTAAKDRVLTEKLPSVLRLLGFNFFESEIPEL